MSDVTTAPEFLLESAIRVPMAPGARAAKALQQPLFVESETSNCVTFTANVGLRGVALSRVVAHVPDEHGRQLEITFRTGTFGFNQDLVAALNTWAGLSFGTEEFMERLQNGGHFVNKEGSNVTVTVLLASNEHSLIIPVYPKGYEQQALALRREQARQFQQGAHETEALKQSYLAAKAQLISILEPLVADRFPQELDDAKGFMAGHASNVMTGEINDKPIEHLSDSQREHAAALGAEVMRTNPEAKTVAMTATYALVQYLLRDSMEPESSIVFCEPLYEARRLLQHAIANTDQPSYYYATLAQCCFTGRENEEAALYANKAVEADPTNAEAWRLKGNSEWQNHRRYEAMHCYEEALRLGGAELAGVNEAIAMLRNEIASGSL